MECVQKWQQFEIVLLINGLIKKNKFIRWKLTLSASPKKEDKRKKKTGK